MAVRVRPHLGDKPLAAHERTVAVIPDAANGGADMLRLTERLTDSFGSQTVTEAGFRFDGVYSDSAPQQAIYAAEVQPFLPQCFDGVHATIFCYGATGSGKTHTACGTAADPGLIPRAVTDLLALREKFAADASNASVTLRASYLEIYQEKVIDLFHGEAAALAATATGVGAGASSVVGAVDPTDLPLREDDKHRIHVVGLTEQPVESVTQVRARGFVLQAVNRCVVAMALGAICFSLHSNRSCRANICFVLVCIV